MWYNSSGFWEAVMRTDSPYHPSRYWEPHIQTCWEFYPTLYNAIQRVWIALVDFWAAGVCTDGTPTPTLPPIQILGTIYPNLLRLSAHIIWCYKMCLDHPSGFLGGWGEYWWHPHPNPTIHPDVRNYWSKPTETFSPCYMMLHRVVGAPKLIFRGLRCGLKMPSIQMCGTSDPNLLKFLSHVIWYYVRWMNHQSWFIKSIDICW